MQSMTYVGFDLGYTVHQGGLWEKANSIADPKACSKLLKAEDFD